MWGIKIQGLRKLKKINSGFVLALALILLLVITLVASTTMMVQRTQMRVGGNYSKVMNNYNVANTGLSRAQEILQAYIVSLTPFIDFDAVLTYSAARGGYLYSTAIGGTPLSHVAYGPKNFYDVFVENNASDITGAGSATNDTDRKIVVTVRGYDSDGRSMTIKTYQESIAGTSLPTTLASTGVCGTSANVNYNASTVSGYDWATPAASCYTVGTFTCLGTKDVDPAHAVGPLVQASVTSAPTGTPTLEGSPAGVVTNAAMQCTQWATLEAQLEPLANRTTTANAIVNATSGTAAIPIVTVIAPASGTLTITGNFYGSGILIVKGNMVISATAKMNFNGIIMLVGDNASLDTSAALAFDGFGSMVVTGGAVDGGSEINLGATSAMKYLSAGMQLALNSIAKVSGAAGHIHTTAWAETY